MKIFLWYVYNFFMLDFSQAIKSDFKWINSISCSIVTAVLFVYQLWQINWLSVTFHQGLLSKWPMTVVFFADHGQTNRLELPVVQRATHIENLKSAGPYNWAQFLRLKYLPQSFAALVIHWFWWNPLTLRDYTAPVNKEIIWFSQEDMTVTNIPTEKFKCKVCTKCRNCTHWNWPQFK